jgi:hypothetical protein
MMEKFAQAGEGGGCTLTSFHYPITYKVVVYMLRLRGQIHSPYFISAPVLHTFINSRLRAIPNCKVGRRR